MKFTPPEFNLKAYNCPFCDAYAHMTWVQLVNKNRYTWFYESECSNCKEPSLWRVTKYSIHDTLGRQDEDAELIYPDNGGAPVPEDDMPEDVKVDYLEASRIFSKSPRGAAALLRLGLQKLCKHLGQKGEHIDTDIRNLAKENILPPLVVKVADTVRITGNNAVHPGEMTDQDFDHVASKMFFVVPNVCKP